MHSIGQEAQRIQEALWKSLQDEARQVMEGTLNRMMEAERMIFVGVAPYERAAVRRGRRNGYDGRTVDSRFGPLRLRIPKVRQSAERFRTRMLRAYQRRQEALDQLALEWVACGMSTRTVSEQLHRAFGALASPGTISALVGQVDAERMAFHQRRFSRGYRYVYLDGKHGKVSRPSAHRGRGRARGAVLLLAWGIRHDGSEELIDFRVAPGESEASWSNFLLSLKDRGLVEETRFGERLERIISDGDGGIEAALAMVYPETPQQVCVFHKIKNLLPDLTDRSCRGAIQGEAGAIFEATHRAEALARLERWKGRWQAREPAAVGHFLRDLDRMLLFYESEPELRRRLKTSNPIERFIRELERKFERVGVFPSPGSWERLTYLVYRQLAHRGYAPIRHVVAFTRTS
jgi:putative transposase